MTNSILESKEGSVLLGDPFIKSHVDDLLGIREAAAAAAAADTNSNNKRPAEFLTEAFKKRKKAQIQLAT